MINSDYELIYGAHSIIEAVKSKKRKIYKVWTTGTKAFERVKNLLFDYTVVQNVTPGHLDKMTAGKHHMGVVAAASPFQYQNAKFDPSRNRRLLLLDGVVDAKNLGAILRSAMCTGFTGVCLVSRGNAMINADTISASAGLAQHLLVKVFSSSNAAIAEIKDSGYKIIVSVVSGGKRPETVDTREPLCLVIGGEEAGVGQITKESGQLVTLEQIKADMCFNASVAGGILMYLLR